MRPYLMFCSLLLLACHSTPVPDKTSTDTAASHPALDTAARLSKPAPEPLFDTLQVKDSVIAFTAIAPPDGRSLYLKVKRNTDTAFHAFYCMVDNWGFPTFTHQGIGIIRRNGDTTRQDYYLLDHRYLLVNTFTIFAGRTVINMIDLDKQETVEMQDTGFEFWINERSGLCILSSSRQYSDPKDRFYFDIIIKPVRLGDKRAPRAFRLYRPHDVEEWQWQDSVARHYLR